LALGTRVLVPWTQLRLDVRLAAISKQYAWAVKLFFLSAPLSNPWRAHSERTKRWSGRENHLGLEIRRVGGDDQRVAPKALNVVFCLKSTKEFGVKLGQPA
jgi:hypothetical protein